MAIAVGEGVKNQLWAATANGVTSGTYYEGIGVSDAATGLANDKEMANKPWQWTENELDGHVL
ncbi:hypothetical protein LTR36_009501 [Oleoguttula mirabilis]|uniref:Uncharacterized protein n=1 Tax=Oleoguttula mirabilis TaxID=1507867 RepID=A0AAV9JU39_9PEZI|nr:hypothetical protein LTR36_009501 [Oleoguttula mirabilis]